MRKIRIIEHITLDGIIQAPGGPDEDPGYPYGGWVVPFDHEETGAFIVEAQGERFDLLFGRATYDIFARFWPTQSGPMAESINAARKFVATHEPGTLAWGPAEALGSDLAGSIRRLKASDGPDLIVWGSSTLTPLLLEYELADELALLVFPVLLGTGKRLFAEGTPPRSFSLVSTKAVPSGAVISVFKPDGPLRTGTFVI